jgi:hypothetical protein
MRLPDGRERAISRSAAAAASSSDDRAAPPGGPGPCLTAAVRDGRTIMRAGTEEWLCRGPN